MTVCYGAYHTYVLYKRITWKYDLSVSLVSNAAAFERGGVRTPRRITERIQCWFGHEVGVGSVTRSGLRSEPLVEMCGDEFIVCQVGVGAVDAVDLVRLPGRQIAVVRQAPAALEETLAAQDFVNP